VIIGILSDTHSFIDDKISGYLKECDEIWHAGDIGSFAVLDSLRKMKPVRAVYGNMDDQLMRRDVPLDQIFTIENMKVWMTHIGGSPGRYDKRVAEKMPEIKPDIFICGHSHILKVMRDNKFNLLFINPGAAGIHGFHKVRTLVKMELLQGVIKDFKVVEVSRRGLLRYLT
jgi:uncharacterized protein